MGRSKTVKEMSVVGTERARVWPCQGQPLLPQAAQQLQPSHPCLLHAGVTGSTQDAWIIMGLMCSHEDFEAEQRIWQFSIRLLLYRFLSMRQGWRKIRSRSCRLGLLENSDEKWCTGINGRMKTMKMYSTVVVDKKKGKEKETEEQRRRKRRRRWERESN